MRRLRHATERLDEADHDPRVLAASLAQVAAVNRWLGARRALLHHLNEMLPAGARASVVDVGTGSGDLPRAIARWARRTGRTVRILAVDRHPQILEAARRWCADWPEIRVQSGDARALPLRAGACDVALMSMTLHHLEAEDQVRALRELHRVARRGVLVGELLRSWPHYLGARILATTVWRRNPITRHDGPISVRRAFRPSELLRLAHAAGLPSPGVYRHAVFRLVLRSPAPRPRPE